MRKEDPLSIIFGVFICLLVTCVLLDDPWIVNETQIGIEITTLFRILGEMLIVLLRPIVCWWNAIVYFIVGAL